VKSYAQPTRPDVQLQKLTNLIVSIMLTNQRSI